MSDGPSPAPTNADWIAAATQRQFLDVISRDEAERRFRAHLSLTPKPGERIPCRDALSRVLAENVLTEVDVPGFDRSNVDGFAVRSADTSGADEQHPVTLRLNREVLAPGVAPATRVETGTATTIATGGMLPRGADAVVMVEHTDVEQRDEASALLITRPVAAGENVTFAGTDLARGETVLRAGTPLTSRELGVLAAVGVDCVSVVKRPRVAIFSTGDELIAPGSPIQPGQVYDSNAETLAAAVAELGCEPVSLGIVPDDAAALEDRLHQALQYDAVLLSGGTSKGAGDLSYEAVSRLGDPGIVAHGVALKPGKPICLAVTNGKPVVILPGFPTSAIFTFHEFVAPVLRAWAGLGPLQRQTVEAALPFRVNSSRGRTEYMLVGLMRSDRGLTAYPMGKGSGSVTTFSQADGFITIDQQTEYLDADETVAVTMLRREAAAPDLVVIGSHCLGLDRMLSRFSARGRTVRTIYVGSQGGLTAAGRGECDIAGMHLFDPETGTYNGPFVPDDVELVPGYRRMQCFVYRSGDERFADKSLPDAIAAALNDPDCSMVNRNAGSGTRVLIDRLLQDAGSTTPPPGYGVQPKSHHAVAAAIAGQRADWGIAIKPVARLYGLETITVQEEQFDFAVPKSRLHRPAVREFLSLLDEPETVKLLAEHGCIR